MITRHQPTVILLAVTLSLGLYWPNCLTGSPNGSISSPSITPSIFDLFSEQEVQELTITTDLVQFMENRKIDEYQEATIEYLGQNGQEVSRNIKLKARGKYRNRVCDFPPIKIKFSKKDLLNAGYNPEFNKLKLVTHCLDEKLIGNENVMKEYLMYKLYNELTPESYRVQLAKITYLDSKGKLGKIKRYGFVIESTDQMAFRVGGTECECMNPNPTDLHADIENRVALFQFMIGNEDWNTMLNRNITLVKPFFGGKMTLVPYDFDFAGAVYPSYAIPNWDLGLTSVRDRFYQGNDVANDILKSTLEQFKQKRADFSAIILNFSPLARTARIEILDYLDSFYDQINQISFEKQDNLSRQLKNAYKFEPQVGSR